MTVHSRSWMFALLGLGVCLPLTAAPAAAQSSASRGKPAVGIGISRPDGLSHTFSAGGGVGVAFAPDESVDVSLPPTASPFAAKLRTGPTSVEPPAAPHSPSSSPLLPVDVGKLLNDFAPGVRLGNRGVEVETSGMRIDTRGGVTVDLDTPRGHIRVSEMALRQFVDAGKLFRERDHERALDYVNRSLQQMPRESRFHQLRSLILFGQRDYIAAADAAYQALAHGAAWDWKTLHGFYTSADAYTAEYRALQHAARERQDSAELHFLLAYHHLMLGHHQSALDELRQVGRLIPEDQLIDDLIRRLVERPIPLGLLD